MKEQLKKAFAPFGRSLASSGVSPNVITMLGPLVAVAAVITFMLPNILFAAFLMLLVGFVDALDGAVARASGRMTAFGGVLDSVCDRYADAILLFGLIWGGWCTIFWGVLALVGSLLVSYARARAESVGVSQLGIGIAERPERIIILVAGTGFEAFAYLGIFPHAPVLFGITLWTEYGVILVAVLTHVTIVQRAIFAYRALARAPKKRGQPSRPGGTLERGPKRRSRSRQEVNNLSGSSKGPLQAPWRYGSYFERPASSRSSRLTTWLPKRLRLPIAISLTGYRERKASCS